MNILSFLEIPVFQALGLSMLHSLWQGLVILGLLQLALMVIPTSTARQRYQLHYLALVLLFGLFATTFLVEWLLLTQMEPMTATGSLADVAAGGATPAYGTSASGWHGWPSFFTLYPLAFIQKLLPYLVFGYVIGICFYYGKMVLGLLRIRRLRRQVLLPEEKLAAAFAQLTKKITPDKKPLLRLSTRIDTVFLTGFIKPLILVPLSLVSRLSPGQLEAILCHELAHLKRNDYIFNILQTVLETFLFFNPATWQLSRSICREREHCCDDLVLRYTGSAVSYAQALLQLAEYKNNGFSPAVAASGDQPATLLHRIKRIIDMKYTHPKPQKTIATIGVLCLIAATTCFFTAWGQTREKAPTPTTQTTGTTDSSSDAITLPPPAPIAPADAAAAAFPAPPTMDSLGASSYQMAMAQAQTALQEASRAIAKVPWDSIRTAISSSMASIPWDSIHVALQQSIQVLDSIELPETVVINQQEMQKAFVDARKEMSAARKTYLSAIAVQRRSLQQLRSDSFYRRRKAVQRQMTRIRHQADSIRTAVNVMATARRQEARELAGSHDRSLRAALRKMEKEGLIDLQGTYDIELKQRELNINGKKQPPSVFHQFKSYFPDGTLISIRHTSKRVSR